MIRSATNPRKAEVLNKLRLGKISVKQAARIADVPVSGIVGWMKLARIPVPAEYLAPRRKPKDGASTGPEGRA